MISESLSPAMPGFLLLLEQLLYVYLCLKIQAFRANCDIVAHKAAQYFCLGQEAGTQTQYHCAKRTATQSEVKRQVSTCATIS